MKLILKYISVIAASLLIFSCDFDENGPMPDNMRETSFAYIDFDGDASSPFINTTDPAAYICSGTIDVLFKERVPFEKVKLMVAMNDAYDKAGIIEDNIVTVPYKFTITGTDIVSALDDLSSVDDITEDDVFKVYVTPTIEGVDYPPYQMLSGKSYSTVSASIMQNLTSFKGINSSDVDIICMTVCPLENGVNDLIGSWSGKDAFLWDSQITTQYASEGSLTVSGMSVGLITDFWGEEITEGGTFTMNVTDIGTVEIPRQYIYTTLYEGASSVYEVAGQGFWNNCGDIPTLSIVYDIYYKGDAAGLGANYGATYLGGVPYLTAEISLDVNANSVVAEMFNKSTKVFVKPPKK